MRSVWLSLTVLLGCLCVSQQACALGVSVEADRRELNVGDTLTVNVTGARIPSEGDPSFVGANVWASTHWKRAGQTVRSPITVGDRMTKSWGFTLVAAQPGTTQVTPVVYLGSQPTLHAHADSALGDAVTVVIHPAPGPSVWPYVIASLLLVAISVQVVRRMIRARQAEEYTRPTLEPLAEALEMLDSMAGNRREDRADVYLGDIKRVVQGYLTRRLDRSVAGWTAHDVARGLSDHINDAEVLGRLSELLTRCDESKFSGARIEFDTLLRLESEAREVLEQMDRTWV